MTLCNSIARANVMVLYKEDRVRQQYPQARQLFMGLFYAYLKDDEDNSYRYIMTFIDRETADEWWRMISTPHSRYAANIRRLSPHFYTQNDRTNNNVARFFTEMLDAKKFHRKMFITMLWNGSFANMIAPSTITDHISGRWYFIRSKADLWSHWYFRTDGACLVCGDANCDDIHVSSEYRTKFCIQARNATNSDLDAPEDFVMIGRDEVAIRAPMGYALHINEVGVLKASTGTSGKDAPTFP